MKIWLAIFSGIAVFNALMFGAYLLFFKGGLLKNRLLGLLLLATGLRIGKSIIILVWPDIHDAVPAIGLIGMASIGPLVLFYSASLIKPTFVWVNRYWFHFVFAFSIGVILLFATPRVIFWLYFIASIQSGGYLLASFNLIKGFENLELQVKWLKLVLGSQSLIWLVFTSQIFSGTLPIYTVGTVLSAAVLYMLMWLAGHYTKVFGKIKVIELDIAKREVIQKKILQLMEHEKLYCESDLTVTKLANRAKEKPYIISMIINEQFKTTVPDFINGYRVKEAAENLLSSEQAHLSVEAIAFDCGFNTLSAFYSSFRKTYGMTPSEYKLRFQSEQGDIQTEFSKA